MRERISRHSGTAALAISILALAGSTTGLASAARKAVVSAIGGHPISAKPRPGGLLLLGRNKQFAAAAIPTVRNATHLGGKALADVEPSCQPTTVDIGTWCLMTSFYPLTNAQAGQNNYFWASQACVNDGRLPADSRPADRRRGPREARRDDPRLAADRDHLPGPERGPEGPARDERHARDHSGRARTPRAPRG